MKQSNKEREYNLESHLLTMYRSLYPHQFLFLRSAFLFAAATVCCNAKAQLCSGSLGDPVVNITFGAGYNPGPALSAATTNYQYVTDPCPVNGFYTLLNSGIECNYGWHVLQRDHTGNTNGYFMLVDASFEPSDFYLDTVKSLCANTTYEFAAWMLNMKYVIQGIRPNITFTIETATGELLQTYNSGDIPVEQTVQWKQYGFYFTTPSNVSAIVLRMRNNAPGGDGNDLAMDDITFRPCGKLITSTITGSTSNTINVCDGNTSVYNFNAAIALGYINPVYHWQLSKDKGNTWNDIEGATNTGYQRTPTETGDYWYRFTIAEANVSGASTCRIASNAIIINVHPNPVVDAGVDINLIPGYAVALHGIATGDSLLFSWSPNTFIDNTATLTPIVSPVQDIAYTLFARSVYGCANNDIVNVKVVKGLYIPSAFTPNGDGKNDRWRIPFLDPAYGATVTVFNRFGNKVYHTTGAIVSWDGMLNGNPQQAGSYVYLITFKLNKLKITGTVTLLR